MTSKKTPSRSRKQHPPEPHDEVQAPTQDLEPSPKSRKSSRWIGIRRDYVEGIPVPGSKDEVSFPTMKELAEAYGLSHHTIRERAAKERWSAARQAYQLQVAEERQRTRARNLAKQGAEFDERAYSAANLGLSIVQVRLAEIMQEVTMRRPRREAAIERMKQGLPVEREDLFSAAYHRELEGLASAMERFQSIGMRALGTDIKKLEVSGADGGPLVQQQINIHAELVRDDAERAAAILTALVDSGQIPDQILQITQSQEEDIVDAELVEDEREEEAS